MFKFAIASVNHAEPRVAPGTLKRMICSPLKFPKKDMKKKLLAAIIGFIACSIASAASGLELTIDVPGTLKEKMLEADADIIGDLTVKGRLNASDLQYLGSAEGLVATIKTLDISQVSFVLNGEVYKETVTPSGSMGMSDFRQYLLWPRDSVSYYYTIEGYVHLNWGNNLTFAFTDSKFEKVILPASIDGLGSNAFAGSKNLKEVVMGNNVKYIGDRAFTEAKELTSLYIPESVDSIGWRAFFQGGNGLSLDLSSVSKIGGECFSESGISSVDLPDREITLSEGMFSNCKRLTKVTIPGKIRTVPDKMFYNCSELRNVTLGEGIKEIGRSAFYSCPFESIILPESLEVIGEAAFEYCQNISEIVIPEAVRIIGEYAFAHCINLSEVNCPAGLESIGASFRYTKAEKSFPVENSIIYFGSAAYGTSGELPSSVTIRPGTTVLAEGLLVGRNLEYVGLPQSLKHIGRRALEDNNFSTINLPEGLISIGDGAFENVPLTHITLPSSLRRIGSEAFRANPGTLTSIDFPEGLEEIGNWAFLYQPLAVVTLPESLKNIGILAFGYNPSLGTINYNCKDATVDLSQYTSGDSHSPFCNSGCDRIIIGDNVQSIPDGLFYMDGPVSHIELPAALKTIGADAFRISSLTTVSFQEGLESIGNRAFMRTPLENAHLPSSLKYIGKEAFESTQLRELTLGENVGYIGDEAFGKIYTLENVYYNCRHAKTDYGVYETQFGPSTFYGRPFSNSTLASLTFGPDVENISTYFFEKSSGFSEIVLPEGCTLGLGSFAGVGSLQKVVLPEDMKSVSDKAFLGCYNLSTVVLPPNLERIGRESFSGCRVFFDFKLPLSIKEIDYRGVAGLPCFTEINPGPNIKKIGEEAFLGCKNVNRIFIPSQIEEIGKDAFKISPLFPVTVLSMLEDPASSGISGEGLFPAADNWTLRVPYEKEEVYESLPSWDAFGHYEANGDMAINLDKGFVTDFSFEGTRALDGVVIGGIYYSFKDAMYGVGHPNHLSLPGSWEITDDYLFDIVTPYNYDLTTLFYGIAVKLPAGEGYMEIESENPGTSLIVRIAGHEPVRFTNQTLESNIVNFNLSEDSFAFIYSEKEDKYTILRSLSVLPGRSGVEDVEITDESEVAERYYPDGRAASATSKGVLIERLQNGTCRKIIRK